MPRDECVECGDPVWTSNADRDSWCPSCARELSGHHPSYVRRVQGPSQRQMERRYRAINQEAKSHD